MFTNRENNVGGEWQTSIPLDIVDTGTHNLPPTLSLGSLVEGFWRCPVVNMEFLNLCKIIIVNFNTRTCMYRCRKLRFLGSAQRFFGVLACFYFRDTTRSTGFSRLKFWYCTGFAESKCREGRATLTEKLGFCLATRSVRRF